jgi:hypothetical protein
MHVAQLAKAAAVSSETVRHCTDLGLLRPTGNPDNGYQQYSSTETSSACALSPARAAWALALKTASRFSPVLIMVRRPAAKYATCSASV